MVTDQRAEKLKRLAANRQQSLTILLENVHDPHNLGAVLRSCDAVGISDIYALYTIESRATLDNISGHKSSSGAKKWVDIHYFDDVDECVDAIKKKYGLLLGTHLASDSRSLYELDLTKSIALAFGNEHRGLSEELLAKLDGNFLIPQFGMVQSLNISVACAVSLYEAMRQRLENNQYDFDYSAANNRHLDYYKHYEKVSRPKPLRLLDEE